MRTHSVDEGLFLQYLPADTAWPGGDLGSELQDPFNLSDEALVVRTPDIGSVFQDW